MSINHVDQGNRQRVSRALKKCQSFEDFVEWTGNPVAMSNSDYFESGRIVTRHDQA